MRIIRLRVTIRYEILFPRLKCTFISKRVTRAAALVPKNINKFRTKLKILRLLVLRAI